MTHPDEYAPRACIAARDPSPEPSGYVMFKLAWDDSILSEYLLDGNLNLIVRDVVAMRGDENPNDEVIAWGAPHEMAPADFRAVPGIFQQAFVSYWTGLEMPMSELSLTWAPQYGAATEPNWAVRRFPSGLGDGPALGELGYAVVTREVITAWYEQRGW